MRNWPTSDNIGIGANKWWYSKYFADEQVTEYKRGKFTTLAQLFKQLDIVASVSEARRNGWDKEIPEGYSEHVYGQHHVYILNVDMNLPELLYLRFISR